MKNDLFKNEALESSNRELRKALKNLFSACEKADFEGELTSYVDGEMLDAAREALKRSYE